MNIEELNKTASEQANALARQQERAAECLDAYLRWSDNARGLLNLATQARKERRYGLAQLLQDVAQNIVAGHLMEQAEPAELDARPSAPLGADDPRMYAPPTATVPAFMPPNPRDYPPGPIEWGKR